MRSLVLVIFILASAAALPNIGRASAQDMNEVEPEILAHPPWLILEYGKRAMD